MCASDLMVEGELGPQNNNENTVVISDDLMLAWQRVNMMREAHKVEPMSLQDFVNKGLITHVKRIWPGILGEELL